MIGRIRTLAVACLLLLGSDATPRLIAPPHPDGITWSPYRPVFAHFHHIPLRTSIPDVDAFPEERV